MAKESGALKESKSEVKSASARERKKKMTTNDKLVKEGKTEPVGARRHSSASMA